MTPAQFKQIPANQFDLVAVTVGGQDPEVEIWNDDLYNQWWESRRKEPTFRCACCNQKVKYNTIVVHRPTGELYDLGSRCATDLQLAQSLDINYATGRLKKRVAAKAKVSRFVDAQSAENQEVIRWMSETKNRIGKDMHKRLAKWGELSPKQISFAASLKQREEQNAEAMAGVAELDEGRYEITGTVISRKCRENGYGSTWKVLVQLADGRKVYGTQPVPCEKGDTITFTARVEKSKDDGHFGFFSRPSKAKLIHS